MLFQQPLTKTSVLTLQVKNQAGSSISDPQGLLLQPVSSSKSGWRIFTFSHEHEGNGLSPKETVMPGIIV